MGFVTDELPASTREMGVARLEAALLAVPGLDVGLSAELSRYARSYVTRFSQPGDAAVSVDETRVRSSLLVGFDVMSLVSGMEALSIEPRLRATVDSFVNDVFPLTSVSIGGDLAIAVRPTERLRLFAEWSYQGVASATEVQVVERLSVGAPIAQMRWSPGVAIRFPPHVELRVAYEGEWLALSHASRFSHFLVLGTDFFL